MEILQGAPKEVWFGELEPAATLPSPPAGAPFALMIVAFMKLPADELLRIAAALVDQGCRYAVCAGVDSTEWETAFDDADLQRNPNCEPGRFVMTTSHPSESLDEVASFLLWCTAIEGDLPARFVVATIEANPSDQMSVKEAVGRAREALPNQPLQRT
jgi:hypothetical protein